MAKSGLFVLPRQVDINFVIAKIVILHTIRSKIDCSSHYQLTNSSTYCNCRRASTCNPYRSEHVSKNNRVSTSVRPV